MEPWKQTCLIAAGILAVIFLVLAGADAGMNPLGAQKCTFEIPKWFGCVLANHEGLSGGLVGGGGALFAAWIAWRAVMDQITAKEDATYEAIRPKDSSTKDQELFFVECFHVEYIKPDGTLGRRLLPVSVVGFQLSKNELSVVIGPITNRLLQAIDRHDILSHPSIG